MAAAIEAGPDVLIVLGGESFEFGSTLTVDVVPDAFRALVPA